MSEVEINKQRSAEKAKPVEAIKKTIGKHVCMIYYSSAIDLQAVDCMLG